MAKFSKAKVGDRIWSASLGWGTVDKIDDDIEYPLHINFDIDMSGWYTSDGKRYINSQVVELYWDEVKMPTDKEDKKPLNLVEFLKDNLKPTEFRLGKTSYSLVFDLLRKEWVRDECHQLYRPETVYFEYIGINVIEELDKNKITPQQLKEAFKKLEWS